MHDSHFFLGLFFWLFVFFLNLYLMIVTIASPASASYGSLHTEKNEMRTVVTACVSLSHTTSCDVFGISRCNLFQENQQQITFTHFKIDEVTNKLKRIYLSKI